VSEQVLLRWNYGVAPPRGVNLCRSGQNLGSVWGDEGA